MNSKKLVEKFQKSALFWPKKGIFQHATKPEMGTPTSHKNRIRGLENALIDLKIGMHVPWAVK